MDKRIGVIGIVIKDPGSVQSRLNQLISEFGPVVIGRMGIPYREKNLATLALLVDGTGDQINALTGKLGALPGVTAKAALTSV